MNKILLVYEDYADLMAVESTLKKVGFDVIGLTSEYSVAEQVLAFNPDLVVGCGNAGKVTALGVGKRLKEMSRWGGKSILVFSPQSKPSPADLIRIRVDMLLETPVAPLRLLQVIGKLLNVDEALLLERLNRAMHLDSSAPSSNRGFTVGGSKNLTENETIFIQGSKTEAEKEGTEASSESEKSEDTEEAPRFRFGDRMSSSQVDEVRVSGSTDSSEAEVAFESVDLKSLEKELLGDRYQEESTNDTVYVTEPESVDVSDIQQKAAKSLQEANAKMAEKRTKYAKFAEEVHVPKESTVTRVEARRRQKELKEHVNFEDLEDQDKLRRQFTKALFKK